MTHPEDPGPGTAGVMFMIGLAVGIIAASVAFITLMAVDKLL